jgi:hypothetical protein
MGPASRNAGHQRQDRLLAVEGSASLLSPQRWLSRAHSMPTKPSSAMSRRQNGQRTGDTTRAHPGIRQLRCIDVLCSMRVARKGMLHTHVSLRRQASLRQQVVKRICKCIRIALPHWYQEQTRPLSRQYTVPFLDRNIRGRIWSHGVSFSNSERFGSKEMTASSKILIESEGTFASRHQLSAVQIRARFSPR